MIGQWQRTCGDESEGGRWVILPVPPLSSTIYNIIPTKMLGNVVIDSKPTGVYSSDSDVSKHQVIDK